MIHKFNSFINENSNMEDIDNLLNQHSSDGYPSESINVEDIIRKISINEDSLIDLVDVIEKINKHNLQVYMNKYFNRPEAIRHSDNLFNTLSSGTSPLLKLKKMSEGK